MSGDSKQTGKCKITKVCSSFSAKTNNHSHLFSWLVLEGCLDDQCNAKANTMCSRRYCLFLNGANDKILEKALSLELDMTSTLMTLRRGLTNVVITYVQSYV